MAEKTETQVYLAIPVGLHTKLMLMAKAAVPTKTLKAIIIEAMEEKVEPLDAIEDLDKVLTLIGDLSR